MANIKKGQSYPDLGFRVDAKGIATDLTTGKSLSRAEVDKRLAGTGMSNIAKQRGGVAGTYDRNKKIIVPAAEILSAMLPGVGPLVSAGIGAATGFDRPGQGGIGYDLGKGALGAASGYALGKVGDMAGNAIGGAMAKPSLGAVGSGATDVANAGAGGGVKGLVSSALPGIVSAAQGGMGMGGGPGGGSPDWLKALLVGGQGINAAQLMGKSLDYAKNAEGTAMSNWNANAPLREAGRAGMLNPKSSVDTSFLPGIRSANPFARGVK